jgi:glucose-1-phosphate adenylyltransferase
VSSILAEGSIVHGSKIVNSVIGIRTRIGKGTEIISSYLMGSDYYETIPEMAHSLERGIPKLGIGERCKIENAIVDKDCRIGNDVSITGGAHLPDSDHALFTVKDGIVVIKKGAILPDGFVI